MATPRSLLVDPNNECDYHIASRCVRSGFLFGVDDLTGHDYSHRRDWVVRRIKQLACCFAVDVYSYTVMSNHFHVVLRYDPMASRLWSDEEVARRWFDAFPPTERGKVAEELKTELRELMLGDAKHIARARRTLGSLSDFMKHLKQPIARRANLEDDCEGHFFEQRFYSGALLTEEALIAAMAYVDLNPVRAKLAQRIEALQQTSVADRLQENSAEALADYLRPVVSGLGDPTNDHETTHLVAKSQGQPECTDPTHMPNTKALVASDTEVVRQESSPPSKETARHPEETSTPPHARRPLPAITLADYLELVRAMAEAVQSPMIRRPNRIEHWIARTTALKKRQRAYGTAESLRQWTADRGMQLRESPLPA